MTNADMTNAATTNAAVDATMIGTATTASF
jgi:hypothetical protein